MTGTECLYAAFRPCDHPLYQHVHRTLRPLVWPHSRVVDIGGRRSHYTIGLSGQITVTELPRTTAIQHALDLGATDAIRQRVLARRSNIVAYVLDDMTATALPAASFDVAVAVEVLEHVADHDAFVRNVSRILRPGGVFVMTTPNGDFIRTPYPDHQRHYRRDELMGLLSSYFQTVDVRYVVDAGRLIRWGTHKPTPRRPLRSLGAVVSLWLSARLEHGHGPIAKRHLLAQATLSCR
jgi:SAM-dependent methyltransferase